METDYSNREIDRMFSEIMESLSRIEAQVMKTNGRVTALEMWREGITGKMIGGMAVFTFVWGVIWAYVQKHYL